MEIYYRRLLGEPPYSSCDDDEVAKCSPKDGRGSKSNLPFSPALLAVICVLAAVFFLISYLVVLKKYRFNSSRITRSVSSTLDRTDDENTTTNEDHGPELIHHIWFIKTVGLQQAVIDSIAIVKYKKGEGLIEGTDCSICLSEFEEDESLRLLSKCSHAFHISCIDTWLASHKNCPLCRAPIVADKNNVDSSTEEMNIDVLNTSEDDSVESNGELQMHQAGEDRDPDENNGSMELASTQETHIIINEGLEKSLPYISVSNRRTEVQANKSAEKEGGSQQVRRSVSLDSSSASAIQIAVANIDPVKVVNEGNYKSLSKIDEVVKSFSFRRYWEKGPISMNRTFSSSGKWPNPRSSRSQDSNL